MARFQIATPPSLPLLALAALLLAGCGREPAAPRASTGAHPPLKIAAYYWPGQYWIDVANAQGWFKAAGLNVEVVDTNADYFGSFKELVAGRLDVVQPTLYDTVLLNAKGADLVCVAVADQSTGADGIGARPGIVSLAGLRGQRIGVANGTYVEYLLSVVLAREGIGLGEVTLVDLLPEKTAAEFVQGAVDAIVTYEPALSEGLKKVRGTKLWDSSNIPGVSPAMIALRRQFVVQRPQEVQTLLQVWHRATEFIREKPDEAFAIVAHVNRKSPAEVRDFTKLDRMLDLRANLAAFSYAAGFESLHGTARVMNDYLIRQNLTSTRLDSTEFLDPRFLKALK